MPGRAFQIAGLGLAKGEVQREGSLDHGLFRGELYEQEQKISAAGSLSSLSLHRSSFADDGFAPSRKAPLERQPCK